MSWLLVPEKWVSWIYDIDIDIARHDSLWAFPERTLQPLSSWKSSSTKRSRDLQKQISKKQIGHLGRCIFWTLTSTAYKTDLQCFFLEYSSKREIHNNMNHTNIYKYQISPLQHGLSPLWWTPWQWCRWAAGTAGGYTACAALRPEEVDKSILTWPNICENSGQLPGFVLWSSHHHCERLPKMQFAKCCWRWNLHQKSSYSISSNKVMKHQICMMCSPSPAAFQRRGAQKICIWKLLSCWQWQNHPHRAHRGYLLRRQDDVSALWSLAPSPKNRWPSHYRLLPGCQQIESLVPTLLRLLLSRWDREDFCLGKPMMLLIRWVEDLDSISSWIGLKTDLKNV